MQVIDEFEMRLSAGTRPEHLVKAVDAKFRKSAQEVHLKYSKVRKSLSAPPPQLIITYYSHRYSTAPSSCRPPTRASWMWQCTPPVSSWGSSVGRIHILVLPPSPASSSSLSVRSAGAGSSWSTRHRVRGVFVCLFVCSDIFNLLVVLNQLECCLFVCLLVDI